MKRITKSFQKNKMPDKPHFSRKDLEKRVEQGTEKAIKEYGYVFRGLAKYDRS